jgi:hypothetical protein
MYLTGSVLTGLFGFAYFGLLNTGLPVLTFIVIVLSCVPHDLMYGPQTALNRRVLHPRISRLLDGLSALFGHLRRFGAIDRHGAARRYRIRLCDRGFHAVLRDLSALSQPP